MLDEIQRLPDLFPLLRSLVDERIRAGERGGQFLILGSASPELMRQSSESLAGRILYLELAPFSLQELWPADGEEAVLVEIGTHSRGAVFTDERKLVTDELREVLDGLGQAYEGFDLGRYDLRVLSEEDLQAGRGLVVLELNGVSGEPLHVFQPECSWWQGMRDMCAH